MRALNGPILLRIMHGPLCQIKKIRSTCKMFEFWANSAAHLLLPKSSVAIKDKLRLLLWCTKIGDFEFASYTLPKEIKLDKLALNSVTQFSKASC